MSLECRACPFCGRELCTDRRDHSAVHINPPCDGFLKMVAGQKPRVASDVEVAAIHAAAERYRQTPRGILDRPKVRSLFFFMLGIALMALLLADWTAVMVNGGACLGILAIDRWMARKPSAAVR